MDLLATDPGAWHIIGWILVLAVCGSVLLWAVSTVLLRGGRRVEHRATTGKAPSE